MDGESTYDPAYVGSGWGGCLRTGFVVLDDHSCSDGEFMLS